METKAPVMKRMYKSVLPSVTFFFKTGKAAHFIKHCYYTDIPSEIEELDAEVGAGEKSQHPDIFIDREHKSVDMNMLDPIEKIKKQAIDDYIKAQNQAKNPSNDRGGNDGSVKTPVVGNVLTSAVVLANLKK